jgi:hypothetical protein
LNKTAALASAVGAAVTLWSGPGSADYAPAIKEAMARDAVHDLGFKSAPVLVRGRTNTRVGTIRKAHDVLRNMIAADPAKTLYDTDAVNAERQRLLAPFNGNQPASFHLEGKVGDLLVWETEEGTTIIQEGVFNLRVFGDGDAYRISNLLDVQNNEPCHLSESEAEAEGLRLIRELELVPESDIPTVRFIKTHYEHFTGMLSDPGDRVVATIIYFGREIGGVPVIGPHGSRVQFELGAGGAIRSVRVDWAPMSSADKPASPQTPVSSELFELRVRGHIQKAMQVDSGPLSYSVDRKVCGYVDFGSAYGKQNVFQLGCHVDYRLGGAEQPHIAWIPLAETPVDGNGLENAAELERAGAETTTVVLRLQAAAGPRHNQAFGSQSGESAGGGCTMSRRSASSGWMFLAGGLLFARLLARRSANRSQHGKASGEKE